jgi:ABC-type polysaccharide/polyol phosphate export permease
MVNPLLVMIVLSVVFSGLFKRSIENFPVYVLTGRVVYSFFSEATIFAMDSIRNNAQLIKKVYVPKYFFPMSRVISSFIANFSAIIPIMIIMIATDMKFHWTNILIILPLFLLLLISIGIGLILSAVNVFFRDIKHLYNVILMLLMYLTPIFYPVEIIPDKLLAIVEWNPLFPTLRMFRDILMLGQYPYAMDLVIASIQTAVFFLIGVYIFYKTQHRFILHL